MNGAGPRAVGRVVSEAELIALVARERAAGRRLVFANGCFDLVHVGHVRYLSGAAAEGDRLIVAVNDDEMVASLKGAGRPIVPAAERAEILAAFASVDYVIVFGDPTVERLLRLLQPEVHCKGPDYTVDTVPERAVVREYGGRTVIIGDAKRHSTRDLVERLSRRVSRRPRPGRDDPMNRILLVRLGALGDVVHAIPVAAALRRAFPSARIDWLVSGKHRAILDLVPIIDRRLVIDGDESAGGTTLLAAVRELRRSRYDLAIDLQGLLKSAALARSSGADRVLGFAASYLRERLARPFYTDVYDPGCEGLYDPRETRHVVEINLGLLQPLGIPVAAPEFPIEHVDSAVAADVCRAHRRPIRVAQPGRPMAEQALAAVAPGPRRRGAARTVRADVGRPVGSTGERELADDLVAHAGGCGDRLAAGIDRRSRGAGARRRRHGVRGHRAGTHRRGGRHADRRHLRSDAAVAQRTVVGEGRHGVACRRAASVTIFDAAVSIGCACSTSKSRKCSRRSRGGWRRNPRMPESATSR